jgi:adenine/guanine phosphoribosyltransferase-like PRPP-binding protein
LAATRRKLREIPANAVRIPATFHPDAKFQSEEGYVSALPLELFAWRDGDKWWLRDVTNPNKTYDYSADAKPDDAAIPIKLFGELDDIDHFPAGYVYWAVPQSAGGLAGQTRVRDQLTWKQAFTYLGLGLAVIGVTLATAGAETPVAVYAVYAFTASSAAAAIAAGIDLAEHVKQHNLDGTTAVLDLVQILANLAGGGAVAAGRIIKVAGAAPAAARFSGAWARAAQLSGKAYVPLTIATGALDVTTVAVMGVDAAKQLDEIDRYGDPNHPERKEQAKMLLLGQLAVAGGLTALSLKGTISLGRGQTLVITPGPDGLPIASRAVGADTVIVDPNIASALEARATNPRELHEGEKTLLKQFDELDPKDVRIADSTALERSGRAGLAPQHGFGIEVARDSPEYTALVKVLEDAGVGRPKIEADREMIADAFFAVTEPGATPKFATSDPAVYNKLYEIERARPGTSQTTPLNKLGKELPLAMPEGFDVTIQGRAIHVLPLPKFQRGGGNTALSAKLKQLAAILKRSGVTNAERQEVINALRTPTERAPGPLDGYVPTSILAENQAAVRAVRSRVAAANPDVIVGMERGGSFLADVITAGDPALTAKVNKMGVIKPPATPEGKPAKAKFAPEMADQFTALADAGAKRIVVVDYYMGGTTASELSDLVRKRLASNPRYADVTVEVIWIREKFGFERTTGAGTTLDPLRGTPRPKQQAASQWIQSAETVTLALGDDMQSVLTPGSRSPIHVFDDDGNIVKTVSPTGDQTTRDVMIELLNAAAP